MVGEGIAYLRPGTARRYRVVSSPKGRGGSFFPSRRIGSLKKGDADKKINWHFKKYGILVLRPHNER